MIYSPCTSDCRYVRLSKRQNREVSDYRTLPTNDDLIVLFGQKIYPKCANQPHQHQYVKQKVRELGRCLLSVRNKTPAVQTLQDCIDPTQFQHVISAVKEMCGFEGEVGKYKTPSLALKIGHSLKKCGNIVKSVALQTGDEQLKKRAIDFLEVCHSDRSSEISTFALQTLHSRQFNKPKRIPLIKDLQKLNAHKWRKKHSHYTIH